MIRSGFIRSVLLFFSVILLFVLCLLGVMSPLDWSSMFCPATFLRAHAIWDKSLWIEWAWATSRTPRNVLLSCLREQIETASGIFIAFSFHVWLNAMNESSMRA